MQRRVTLAATTVGAALALLITGAPAAHTADAQAAAFAPGTLTSQDIATAGTGSPYYRIPALTRTTKGTLIAAYDARPTLADLPGNLSVVLRRSTDNGLTWQPQQVVRREAAPKGFGDPSLLVDRETGRIFVFYAASVNQGFFGSATGNDENDPNVLQADYSYSDDDGLTWKHERITAEIKNPAWAGMFAASGEGIQLRHGAYKGRLIQQYAIRNNGANYAVSAYSDDHGATWKMGTPVGPGGDENKTVELSDGRVMLNNRSAPYRTVAYSSDGGVTYTPFQQDTELPDPANNGSVMRFAPDVDASHPRAKWLMFSNTATTNSRSNLTVRLSCDNGQNWPVRKTVEAGSAAYSTLTPLGSGTTGNDRVGMLWERANYRHITYSSFDLQWLGGVCAPVTVTPPASLPAGKTTTVTVRVVSQNDVTLPGGTVSLALPAGWSAPEVAVPALNPGQGANMKIPVTVPAGATAGSVKATAKYTVRGRQHSYGDTTFTVTAP
ncbi:neuramidase [Streptomyces sp. DH-12]|uniref:exo-alpha-sialidase n=1 Tax=unclassified Streptomyces TaxID=2593676 RepID=UPI000CCE8F6B|nr:exo-alpha-sialidase [Streptomyces sp. DH-12]PNV31844.1 neuramidase [Streptomyces sp. DH-12]